MNGWLPAQWVQKLKDLRTGVEGALRRWFQRYVEHSTSPGPVQITRKDVWGWPTIDLEDYPDRLVVRADIPGLEPEDIRIELLGDTLVLRGEKRREQESRADGYFYSERWYGAFVRHLALPVPVRADEASARYRSGQLVIELPKQTPATRVPIRAV